MTISVQVANGVHFLAADWPGVAVGNDFLRHLRARAFSPATVRAHAFDVANLARFLEEQNLALAPGGADGRLRLGRLAGRRTPAMLRLASCVLIEVHDEWQVSDRRYLFEGS